MILLSSKTRRFFPEIKATAQSEGLYKSIAVLANRVRRGMTRRVRFYFCYYFNKFLRSRATFRFQGKRYRYFVHKYNATWRNERSIEIPIVESMMHETRGDVLEIGNVISHYFKAKHDIVDKYERAEGVTAQDVTESRTMSMELERKEEMLRRVLEALPVGVWIADATGRITTTNQAAIEIWGAASHIGVSEYEAYKAWDLKSGQRVRSEDCPMARALLTGKPQSGREARIETFDGKARVIRSWGAPVVDSKGKVTGAIGVAEDITSKFAIQQALSRSHEELRRLTQHQIRIRELEKASIAKDLHEGIGQTLSGALMQIASLRKDPAAKQELADKCAGLEAVLKEAIESIRRLSSELRPPLLNHFGLEDALDWLVVETREKSGIACSLSIKGKMPKGDDVRSLELFRICQDAFSNAMREGATRIDVSVRGQRSGICLEVKDNGLLSSESAAENALAIIGMRERVGGMCGTFEIRTDPVHGRVACISIPRAGLYAQREQ